jgi:hypothetical protein
MTKDQLIILILLVVAALVTLAYVYVLFHKVSKIKVEDKRIDEVHKYIHKGALTFLFSEYKVIIPFVIVVAILLTVLGFIPNSLARFLHEGSFSPSNITPNEIRRIYSSTICSNTLPLPFNDIFK